MTGNKKLFEVEVLVNKKINIQKDNNPKSVTIHSKIRFI